MADTDKLPPATDTGAPASWLSALPEEARTDPNVTKYKDAGEFYKGYKNTLELVGRKGVIVPKSDDPKEWDGVYNALGRPEKPDAYKLNIPEKLHPSVKITPEYVKGFSERVHALGLNNRQADELNKTFLATLSTSLEQRDKAEEQRMNEGKTKLMNEWGKDWEGNKELAKRFVSKLGGPNAINELGDFANNPTAIKILYQAAKMMSEDSITKMGFSAFTTDSNDARRQIESIKSDPKHPYYDEKHPQHGKAVKEVTELYKLAYD